MDNLPYIHLGRDDLELMHDMVQLADSPRGERLEAVLSALLANNAGQFTLAANQVAAR